MILGKRQHSDMFIVCWNWIVFKDWNKSRWTQISSVVLFQNLLVISFSIEYAQIPSFKLPALQCKYPASCSPKQSERIKPGMEWEDFDSLFWHYTALFEENKTQETLIGLAVILAETYYYIRTRFVGLIEYLSRKSRNIYQA